MKWIEERAQFQRRIDELSQENIQALITDLNVAVGNYIAQGATNTDPNSTYNTILQLTQKAENIKQRYVKLNNDIIQFASSQAKDSNLSILLSENGELQKQIQQLEKIQDKMKIDVESAVARDHLLRSRNTDITSHKLFILDRPVRTQLIPYLWAVSVLFIGIGLVIFRITAPTIQIGQSGDTSILTTIMDFFSNKMVLGSLLISALIVILFLSLKIAGVFGK